MFIHEALKLKDVPEIQKPVIVHRPKKNHASSLSVPTFTGAPMFTTKQLPQPQQKTIPKLAISIEKWHFQNLSIIGQVDDKFIVCSLETKESKCLILIDPHATEERIMVEHFTSLYLASLNSAIETEFIHACIFIALEFESIVEEYKLAFSVHGIHMIHSKLHRSSGNIALDVKVTSLLISDFKSCSKENAVENLVLKCLQWIQKQSSHGITLLQSGVPLPIQEAINSKACRFSIC